MKILYTYKPLGIIENNCHYSGLCEFDLVERKISRNLILPGASYQTRQSFSAPVACGFAIDKDYIYVTVWNYICVVNAKTFEIAEVISTPEMADLHSVLVDGDSIYVISTATECLICLDKRSFKKKWVWGHGEDILSSGREFLKLDKLCHFFPRLIKRTPLRFYVRQPLYLGQETRHLHKSINPYYRHHMNEVTAAPSGEEILINTKGWFDSTKSSVIAVKKDGLVSRQWAKPGSFYGSHDGTIYGDFYYVTESDNNSIARMNIATGEIERIKIYPEGYFVRGLQKIPNGWLVGLTPVKGSDLKTYIGIYAETFEMLDLIEIRSPYGSNSPVAIHAIHLMHSNHEH